jgi:uncharacterized protein with HEPN domain
MDIEQKSRLRDILEAVKRIDSYLDGVSKDAFSRNVEKQDAVIRRIEIIGEATSHLSPETRAMLSGLPYRKMRGMRNVVAHDYANVDIAIVWEVATVHLNDVRRILEEYFERIGPVHHTEPK